MGRTDEKFMTTTNECLTNFKTEESKELMVKEIVRKRNPYIPPYCEVIKPDSGNNLLEGWGLQSSKIVADN
ncbi:hypothetical protein [Hoylesella timonensis]|uniref:Uncharacterized protein n=1 Tax=Hoylesella timonensis TaxID=386414 RepID=A0A2N6Q4F5_9BACT|nr:hypothetical protein [Hoylesella timonensis]PMC08815.1 hypothetical protein CJ232_08475 [Hoylesella timonensis]